jgi:cation-transporting ATPase E
VERRDRGADRVQFRDLMSSDLRLERPTGLSAAQVRERLDRGQANIVVRRGSRRAGEIVRANVFTRFNAIIGSLFVVILVIGPVQDSLFGFIILVNTGIGIVQELRAKRTLDRLAILGEARPRVVRDGELTEVPVAGVVLDDVVELGAGDHLVVDGTVLASAGLAVDESLLTGEPDPVAKRPGDQVRSGSFVVAGTGHYRAAKVGNQAYANELVEQASRFTLTRSELRSGIDQLLRWITWLFVPAAAVTVYGQLRAHQPPTEMVRGTVAALVPMVPEGLVLLTSIAFAVGVIRLGRRRCLVQELPALEGLARVDTVCTDKTGTLTETGMRVGRILPLSTDPDTAAALAALAAADPRPNPSLQAIADAYPNDPGWPVTATAAFSSATRWSGAGFGPHGNWVLGAPDVLLSPTDRARAQADALGAEGLRVLLLGRSRSGVDEPEAPATVTPVALVVLEQRIRPDAAATLDFFAAQDVEVKVLSGDSARSVGAVAGALRLPGAEHPVDARGLPGEPTGLSRRMSEGRVFGRVSPHQKQAMVQALQAGGHIVAMTGDGVNDVLALKEADIGVAMGTGSPATRAVAQVVLLDNAFAALPQVVAEGRRVIGNIERVAGLFLLKTVYSVLLAFGIGLVHLPFPFLPRHLTLIGTLTIGIPAFFLALAPNTERARPGFIRRVLWMAVPVGTVAAVVTFGCYYLVLAEGTATETQNRTAATTTLFLIALWAVLVVARPYRWWKIVLIASVVAAFGLVLLVPIGREFFALDPFDRASMLTAVAAAGCGALLIEAGWWWRFAWRRRRGAAVPAG